MRAAVAAFVAMLIVVLTPSESTAREYPARVVQPVVAHDLYRGVPSQAKREARRQSVKYGWASGSQWRCLDALWGHESGWHWNSNNGDGYGTWGIPQAHPGSKMSSAGPDWRTNVTTQIRWGLRYIKSTYGSPCRAWGRWQDRAASGSYGWY